MQAFSPTPGFHCSEGIKICRENDIRFILAVGGGSAIDSAKAISVGALIRAMAGFYEGNAAPKEALPVATIVTIPAAGSESSFSSVITKEEGWYKRGLNSELLFPRLFHYES